MLNPESFFNILKKENINFFSGVPDSFLVNISNYISDNTTEDNHIIAANEGNALSVGIGYHLATNNLPLIYMQNSGLGNIINPTTSLADPKVYGIPIIFLIGWRGENSKNGRQIKDEPQHLKQGKITLRQLEILEIPYKTIDRKTKNVDFILKKLKKLALKRSGPVALVVKKGAFSKNKISKVKKLKNFISRENENGGPVLVTLIADDLNRRLSVSDSFEVLIGDVNDAPLASDITIDVNEDSPQIIFSDFSDIDNDNSSISIFIDENP